MKKMIVSVTVCAVFVIACDNASAPSHQPQPVEAPKPAVVTASAPITTNVRLEKLGLKFTGPRRCSASDNSDGQKVSCPGLSFDVTPVTKEDPKTFDLAKKEVRRHTHLVIMKEEVTEDGWNIQFRTSDPGADIYVDSLRRTIGGKQYKCETTTSRPEEAEKVADACQSLASL